MHKTDVYQSWWQRQSHWEFFLSRVLWLRWGWLRMFLARKINYSLLMETVPLFFF